MTRTGYLNRRALALHPLRSELHGDRDRILADTDV